MRDQCCQDAIDRKFHNIFDFEYGPLDDQTFWVSSGRNTILRIDKLALSVVLDLNTGKSIREVAQKYSAELEHVTSIYNMFQRNGFLVGEHLGRIRRVSPEEDADIVPYLFAAFLMVLGQVFYFRTVAKTVLMSSTAEGIMVALVAFAAIFIHETGHYLLSWRFTKVRPQMRFTMMKIFPAVYVDTNLAWRLPRNKRLEINLGGVFFDLIVNTAAALLVWTRPSLEYYVTPFLLTQYMRISILANPLFQGDGYWVLSDILGIANMEKRGQEALKEHKVNFLSAYGLVSVLFSVSGMIGLLWFAFNLARPFVEKWVLPFIK